MVSITKLPFEIHVQIVRYANIRGDLPSLRLSCVQLNDVAIKERRLLLTDLRRHYGISTRVVDLYLLHKLGREPPASLSLMQVMAVGRFLRNLDAVAFDLDRMAQRLNHVNVRQPQIQPECVDRSAFMLFAALSRLLNGAAQIGAYGRGDVLAPCLNARHAVSILLSKQFVQFVREELTLEELESVIAAINLCVTRLWSTIFLFRPRESIVSGFGSLCGASFNADQAILTEDVIWRGPEWASKVLEFYGRENVGCKRKLKPGEYKRLDTRFVSEGIWKGSPEEGARLAANGVARMLWKERQQRIEDKVNISVR
ncbi:hypothetical protein ABEF95_011777 [Exophiala dermatitidis]